MKNYKKLRAAMLMNEVKLNELAELIGVAHSTMSFKLAGKAVITVWEAFQSSPITVRYYSQ